MAEPEIAERQTATEMSAANDESAAIAEKPAAAEVSTTHENPAANTLQPTELQEEVKSLIRPWVKSAEHPPFTYEELVVIALLLANEPVTSRRIHNLITRKYRYFLALAVHMLATFDAASLRYGSHDSETRQDAVKMQKNLVAALHQYEVPIERMQSDQPGPGYSDSAWLKSRYAMSEGAARIFLRHLLRPGGESETNENEPMLSQEPAALSASSMFFGLASEIRNFIYELVLLFPKSGVAISSLEDGRPTYRCIGSETVLKVYTRDMNQSFDEIPDSTSCWAIGGKLAELNCRKPKTILALLQVNKQIHQEAMPIFYGGNSFNFSTAGHLHALSDRTSDERWACIRHIRFNYKRVDRAFGPKAFKALKKIPSLRELDIWVWKDDWLERPWMQKIEAPTSLLKIPGISTLRTITGLTALRFYGDCDELHQLVPKIVKQENSKTAKQDSLKESKTSRKRKGKTQEFASSKATAAPDIAKEKGMAVNMGKSVIDV